MAPRYNPNKWNKNKYRKKSHNCYSYFLNKTSRGFERQCKKTKKINKKLRCRRPQPGYAAGYSPITNKKHYTCRRMNKRMMADNPLIRKTSKRGRCGRGYYKGAMVIDPYPKPDIDYHFYRQDRSGMWSHKDAWGPVTNKDARGKVIKDPADASRDYRKNKGRGRGKNYTRFCGYYCVPKDKRKKRMSI